jgi:hypothetical protein
LAAVPAPAAGQLIENFRCTYDNKEINEARNTNLAVLGVNIRADRTEYVLWESKVEKDKKKPFLKFARLFVSGPNERKLYMLWHGGTGEGANNAQGFQERVLMEPEEADKLLATLEGVTKLDPRQEVLFCAETGLAVSLGLNRPALFAFYNQHSSQFTPIEVPWGEELAALTASLRRLTKGP